MRRALWLLALLCAACTSSLPEEGALDAKAKTAPLQQGIGALQPDFDPERAAPVGQSATTDHSHHQPGNGPTTYTCPHHPDVLRDAPGKCPVCGMTLEPKHDHDN